MENKLPEKKVYVKDGDLGSCAYLMLSGYKVSDHDYRAKSFTFEILESEAEDFKSKQLDYLNSEFHRFDSYIMSLKKRLKPN